MAPLRWTALLLREQDALPWQSFLFQQASTPGAVVCFYPLSRLLSAKLQRVWLTCSPRPASSQLLSSGKLPFVLGTLTCHLAPCGLSYPSTQVLPQNTNLAVATIGENQKHSRWLLIGTHLFCVTVRNTHWHIFRQWAVDDKLPRVDDLSILSYLCVCTVVDNLDRYRTVFNCRDFLLLFPW